MNQLQELSFFFIVVVFLLQNTLRSDGFAATRRRGLNSGSWDISSFGVEGGWVYLLMDILSFGELLLVTESFLLFGSPIEKGPPALEVV